MMRVAPLPSRARWRRLYESFLVLLSAAAHVESAVHADRHLPRHVGTLTGTGEQRERGALLRGVRGEGSGGSANHRADGTPARL